MMRWLLMGALIIAGCDSKPPVPSAAVKAAADAHEAALIELQRYNVKYGGDDARRLMLDRPGSGQLGGMAVQCGKLKDDRDNRSPPRVRAMRAGQSNIHEAKIGLKPEVFDELWRRAGC